MIRLVNNAALEWVCDASISSNQLHGSVSYLDMPKQGGVSLLTQLGTEFYSKSNHITDVTACPAPEVVGTVRVIDEAAFYNADSSTATVTVKVNNGTDYVRVKQTLSPGETLTYSNGDWGII